MVHFRGQTGNPVMGQHVNDTKFQGVSTLNQLEAYGLRKPTTLLNKKAIAGLGMGVQGDRIAELRGDIQRTWDKSRRSRAEVYSVYIEKVECDGQSGGTPAITIYAQAVTMGEDEIVVPYSSALVAVDGETQLEARYLLRERRQETGDNPIAVTFYHDVPVEMARQLLHDYNRYAKPIAESKLGSFSSTGAISRAIDQALTEAGFDLDQVNRKGNLPGKKFIASYTQLMHFTAGFAMGEVALGANAVKWFDGLNSAVGSRAMNHGAPEALAAVLTAARHEPLIRQAPTQVWQCAGIKSKVGKTPVNWSGGVDAYTQTRTRQRGGERVNVKDRLTAIYHAV